MTGVEVGGAARKASAADPASGLMVVGAWVGVEFVTMGAAVFPLAAGPANLPADAMLLSVPTSTAADAGCLMPASN